MSQDAKLLHYRPGTMTSIEIPLTNGNFGEVSFKSTVNNLISKSRLDGSSEFALGTSSTSILPSVPVFKEPKHRSNPYDNIIEKLERKYTNHMIICDEEHSEEGSDESDGDCGAKGGKEKGLEKGEKDVKGKGGKRKRRSNPYDAYDFDGESFFCFFYFFG